MIDEQVLAAYQLYKSNLISKEVFYETIEKIKNSITKTFQEITEGQANYIKRLQNEGKIPKTQSLNISKSEAQLIIHNAVSPNKSDERAIPKFPPEQAQTGSDLYSEIEDY